MADRIQVRGVMSGWFHVWRAVCFLGAAGFFALAWFNPSEPIPFIVFGAIAAGLFVWLEIWAVLLRSRRTFLEVLDDGFIVQDRRGQRSYRDSQVKAMAYWTKDLFNNGRAAGFKRDCKIWLANESDPVVCDNSFKLGQTDPVAPFIKRLLELLSAGFSQALEHGLPLEGDGWKLTGTDLTYARGTLPIDQISAVEDHDGKMGVWRKGEALPAAQFPVSGRNVWLLRNVLTPRLKKDAAVSEGLGRVLFQRQGRLLWIILVLLVALGFVGGGLSVVLTSVREQEIGGVMALIGLVIAFFGLVYARVRFRCLEGGVVHSGLFGQRQLMYRDIKSFTYGATRHYHNGAYVGTRVNFFFEPISVAEHGKAISYSTSVNGGDQELDRLRDVIAKIIAVRMQNELAAGARVPWTANIAFLPKGFEYRPSGFLGRKDALFLPYEQYGGWNMNAGQFFLYEKGNKKAVYQEAAATRNFYPGFSLLLAMFHSAPAAPAVKG
jgi:hypothetical protein